MLNIGTWSAPHSYRHFPSKAALRDAVTERWLARLVTPLEAVVAEKGRAPKRIRRWLELLITSERQKAREDPELFATYVALRPIRERWFRSTWSIS